MIERTIKGQAMNRREFVAGSAAAAALAMSGRGAWAQSAEAVNGALVRTSLGSLRGTVIEGVRVFRGVPFAEPPVGSLRFKPPVKVKAWNDEREASHFAAAAVQDEDWGVAKSEDCLYLNVWTPPGAMALPVFVWIHGGGFTGGESFAPISDGTQFAKQGVIVVTVAYRLGVLGFLEMGPLLGEEYAGSGNNGLRDLICALEWVRDHIAAFGGDPTRVTVGGESAGAKLTDVLMGVPAARGLFQQMISESGGAERVWPQEKAQAVARGFGEVWGAGRVAELPMASAEELMSAQVRFLAGWPQHFPLRTEVDGQLIPRMPVLTIAEGGASGAGGGANSTRLLIGTNLDESALFVGTHPSEVTAAELGNVSLEKFQQVYAGYAGVYPELSEERRRVRALTAEEYLVPSVRVAEAQVRGGGKAWMYRLDFAPGSGRMKGFAAHTAELGLVWDKPNEEISNAAAERSLAKQVHAAWLAFIKGGAPAAAGLPVWPEYSPEARETMIFDAVSRVEAKPEEAELRLWDGVL